MLVNHERVGTLNCSQVDPTFTRTTKRPAFSTSKSGASPECCFWRLRGRRSRAESLRLPIGKRQPDPQHPKIIRRRLTPTCDMRALHGGGRTWPPPLDSRLSAPRPPQHRSSWCGPWPPRLPKVVLAVGVVAAGGTGTRMVRSEDRTHQMEEELAARQSTQDQIDQVHRQPGLTRRVPVDGHGVSRAEQDRLAQLNTRRGPSPIPNKNSLCRWSRSRTISRPSRPMWPRKSRAGCAQWVSAVEADRDVVRQDLQSIKSVNETLIKQVALLEPQPRIACPFGADLWKLRPMPQRPKPTVVAKNDPPKECRCRPPCRFR